MPLQINEIQALQTSPKKESILAKTKWTKIKKVSPLQLSTEIIKPFLKKEANINLN
jgi:hypothetical protein